LRSIIAKKYGDGTMIAKIRKALNLPKRIFRKEILRLNDFENISGDELLCREYIEYSLIDKSKRPRECLVRTMLKGCLVLEEVGVKYWIGRGSLLGFHRDNDFLPKDIDIDISVYTDKDVYKIIQKMPFDALFVTNCRGRYMQLAFLDNETNVIFDIWFYHDSDIKIYNRNFFGYFWLPKNKIDNLTAFNFEGKDYPVPDPEWFCSFWYGDNWRTPKEYKTSDWTIPYREDCKGFLYYGIKNVKEVLYYPQAINKNNYEE
jgi:hypothetical protein